MVNDVGILVICLCSLLVYPVPVGTYPNIWLFNTVWTQLLMDSSGRMEMMFHSQVLRFNQGTVLFRELSLKGVSFPTVDSMILLQNSRGLHWDSPVGACRKFRTAFFPPWRAPRPRGLLGCMAQTAGLLAWQPGPAADRSCSGLHSKLKAFHVIWYTGWNTCEICCL